MLSLIKKLIIIDVVMALAGVVLYLLTVDREDSWGYIVGVPLIGVTILSVVILALAFAVGLRASITSKKSSLLQLAGITMLLIGVPLLGIVYASNGENRTKLWVLCIPLLLIGCLGLLKILKGNPKE